MAAPPGLVPMLDDPESLIRAAGRRSRQAQAAGRAALSPPPPLFNGNQTIHVQVEGTSNVTFNGARGAQLKVVVEVHTVERPPRISTELGYYAYIMLRRPRRKRFEEIGHLKAWKVIKPSVANPTADPQQWITDWIDPPLRTYDRDSETLAGVLREIYEFQGGIVRDEVEPAMRAEFANDATGNDLVYIQQLFISDVSTTNPNVIYAGNDYGRQALEMFYRLLTGNAMPADYRFSGPTTILLEPGYIRDPTISARWINLRQADETDGDFYERIRGMLHNYYLNRGFEQYLHESDAFSHRLYIFGRPINPPPFPSRSTDRRRAFRGPVGFRNGSPNASPSPRRPAGKRRVIDDSARSTPNRVAQPQRSRSS